MGGTRLGPPSADCTVVELDGRVSVYSPVTHEVQMLDEQATAVWRLLDGSRDEDELVATLAEQYRAPAAVVRADVAALLARLHAAGVL